MPRKEFIEDARRTLASQKASADQAAKTNLHKAEVLKADGPRRWNALTDELKSIVMEISGSHGPEMEYKVMSASQVQITNKITQANVFVNFDTGSAQIRYGGAEDAGAFVPRVNGNELIYSANVQQYPRMGMSAEYSAEEMAEKITKTVLGLP